jgi:hypothetical protein
MRRLTGFECLDDAGEHIDGLFVTARTVILRGRRGASGYVSEYEDGADMSLNGRLLSSSVATASHVLEFRAKLNRLLCREIELCCP